MRKYIILFSAALGLFSCIKEKEEMSMKTIHLNFFNQIELDNSFDVIYTEENQFLIHISASESIIEHIEYSVKDSILSIKNTKKFKWNEPQNNQVKLEISSMGLKRINANETCNIKTNNAITTQEFGIVLKSKANEADIIVNNTTFFYWNHFPCGGKLTVRGISKELKFWNSALMSIDAKNCISDYVLIDNESKGDCEVYATQRVDYHNDGEGDIIIYGSASEVNNLSTSTKQPIFR